MIMAVECIIVAMLYVCNEKSVNEWRAILILYSQGVSVEGNFHVLRTVGMYATASIDAAMTTEIVASLVTIQGIIPSKAIIRKYVSVLEISLKPYLRERIKIVIVNSSAIAVGKAPIPAPSEICPKNVIRATMVHTNQVYG